MSTDKQADVIDEYDPWVTTEDDDPWETTEDDDDWETTDEEDTVIPQPNARPSGQPTLKISKPDRLMLKKGSSGAAPTANNQPGSGRPAPLGSVSGAVSQQNKRPLSSDNGDDTTDATGQPSPTVGGQPTAKKRSSSIRPALFETDKPNPSMTGLPTPRIGRTGGLATNSGLPAPFSSGNGATDPSFSSSSGRPTPKNGGTGGPYYNSSRPTPFETHRPTPSMLGWPTPRNGSSSVPATTSHRPTSFGSESSGTRQQTSRPPSFNPSSTQGGGPRTTTTVEPFTHNCQSPQSLTYSRLLC